MIKGSRFKCMLNWRLTALENNYKNCFPKSNAQIFEFISYLCCLTSGGLSGAERSGAHQAPGSGVPPNVYNLP